jgi:3'(2'), 5'-bisphosphate nucleotidase
MCIAATTAASGTDPVSFKNEWSEQLKVGKETAKRAGELLLSLRTSSLQPQQVVLENGKKVLQTRADLEASAQIIKDLSKTYTNYAYLSQDQMEKAGAWHTQENVWIINPIDNTSEFEKGRDDFHVQIGLIHQNEAVVGISYYPAKEMYVYAVKGQGAWKEMKGKLEKLVAKPCAKNILLKSSSHALIEPLLEQKYEVADKSLSSTSRLLEIIEGNASLYISLGASPQGKDKKGAVWNYAANTVIAHESGVSLFGLRGDPLNLREPTALLTEGVILTTDPQALAHFTKHFKNNW